MDRLSQICNMLSDKNRLRILKLLEYKPMCVCELTHIIGIRQPSISRHLRKLKEANLIDSRQDGQWHEYFINRSGDEYTRILIGNLSGWLHNDPVVVQDMENAKNTSRDILCKYM